MGIYYTKCGRQFKKSSSAEVTGYQIDSQDLDCVCCQFNTPVNRYEGNGKYEEVRRECRAGSLPPNRKNNYGASSEDNFTCLYIRSLDMKLFERIKEFCSKHEGFAGASFNQDEKDCRKCLSISFNQNKSGIELKKLIINEFFKKTSSVQCEKAIETEIVKSLEQIGELKKLLGTL